MGCGWVVIAINCTEIKAAASVIYIERERQYIGLHTEVDYKWSEPLASQSTCNYLSFNLLRDWLPVSLRVCVCVCVCVSVCLSLRHCPSTSARKHAARLGAQLIIEMPHQVELNQRNWPRLIHLASAMRGVAA